jgi:hypothetical protein
MWRTQTAHTRRSHLPVSRQKGPSRLSCRPLRAPKCTLESRTIPRRPPGVQVRPRVRRLTRRRYHGWKYDAEGKVAHIPALLPDRQIPANAHVHRYPLEERYGLIWIWPGPTDDADPLQIPNILPGLEDPSKWSKVFTIAVDLDIDHSLMVENLLDPACVSDHEALTYV